MRLCVGNARHTVRCGAINTSVTPITQRVDRDVLSRENRNYPLLLSLSLSLSFSPSCRRRSALAHPPATNCTEISDNFSHCCHHLPGQRANSHGLLKRACSSLRHFRSSREKERERERAHLWNCLWSDERASLKVFLISGSRESVQPV